MHLGGKQPFFEIHVRLEQWEPDGDKRWFWHISSARHENESGSAPHPDKAMKDALRAAIKAGLITHNPDTVNEYCYCANCTGDGDYI